MAKLDTVIYCSQAIGKITLISTQVAFKLLDLVLEAITNRYMKYG